MLIESETSVMLKSTLKKAIAFLRASPDAVFQFSHNIRRLELFEDNTAVILTSPKIARLVKRARTTFKFEDMVTQSSRESAYETIRDTAEADCKNAFEAKALVDGQRQSSEYDFGWTDNGKLPWYATLYRSIFHSTKQQLELEKQGVDLAEH